MLYHKKNMQRHFTVNFSCSCTISSIEKNSLWTGAGLHHTQAASWAIDWTVHSKRKKFAGSLSHIVWRVRRSWQHSWESLERNKEACSRWKACRFFTAKPGDTLGVTEMSHSKSVSGGFSLLNHTESNTVCTVVYLCCTNLWYMVLQNYINPFNF